MRFALAIGLALALVTGPLCANAQDDPTPDTQAALDTVRAALDDFAQAETYSGQITQTIEQVVTITYMGETVALTQHMKLEGTVVVQQAPGQSAANRQIDFVQSIAQTMEGGGLDEATEIGPVAFHVRVVDNRYYLHVEADDPAVAAQFPAGWRDVTDGAGAFPGMSLFDIEGVLAIDGNAATGLAGGLLDAVIDISQEPGGDLTEEAPDRYRLELDPARTLDLIGLPAMSSMFEEGRVPFDVPALIERLFYDDATRYTVHVAIDPRTNALVEYVDEWQMDVAITPDLMTDPALEGATMTIEQHSVQAFRPAALNEAVTITAPEIAE